MSNLFLTNIDMSSVVTSGAETTRHKLAGSAGAASTARNKNETAAPANPLKITDSAVAGTDGASIAWYSEQLQAVTIAGQIVASLWCREAATTNNTAPCVGVYRCDQFGAELATIVDPAVNQGGGEMATTAGGASDVVTITAANVLDTAIAAGERLKVALFIDNAADQGGTGTMGTGNAQYWVNGPTGAAGQAQIAFTETILSLIAVGAARQPYVSRRAAHRAAAW